VWVIRIGIVVVLVALWQAATSFGIVDPFVASTPMEVATTLVHLLLTSALWFNLWQTFSAALIGLVIGSVLGMGGAVLFRSIPMLDKAVRPYLTLFNAMPRPALAPIFILWFGLGAAPKVWVAVSLVFFIVLLSTRAGLDGIDPDTKLLGTSLGITRWQRFRLVELPSALPSVVAGLRLGVVYAVLGVVVSEMVASYNGLGQELVRATNSFNVAKSFAIIAIMALLAVTLDFGVGVLERRFAGTRAARR
jgi:NitT/TauT family transport system permease protein